jgi:hypothetical protein
MNRRSLEKLQFDRRLVGRRGWISRADLAAKTEALPDASEKIAATEAQPDPGEIDAVPPEADPQISTGPDTA